MMRRLGFAVAAAASALLLLAGCVPSEPAAPAGLSAVEIQQYTSVDVAQRWADLHAITGAAEPVLPAPTVVSKAMWPVAAQGCLDRSGTEDADNWMTYSTDGSRGSYADDARGDALQYADLYCQSTIIRDPAEYGLLSGAEKRAMYDYYRFWLIPCLRLHALTVADVPSRSVFARSGAWNPYLQYVQPAKKLTDVRLTALDSACPAYPDWYRGPGLFGD